MAKKKPKKIKVKYTYKPNPEMLEKGLELLNEDFRNRYKEIKKKAEKYKPQKVVAIIILDRTTGKKKTVKGKKIEQEKRGFMVDIKPKKTKSKKWKPTKRFLYQSKIDPKTEKTIEFYITAKTKEEEKKIEEQIDQMFLETVESILSWPKKKKGREK